MDDHSFNFNQQSSSELGRKSLAIGAGALILFGLSRRSKAGTALAAAAGAVVWKAARSQSSAAKPETSATFLVNTSAEQAYGMWRNFEDLPRFMAHLKSVRMIDDRRSDWVALGPMGREVRWTAETTEDIPNQRIAWRSFPGSDVETSGRVEFRPDPLGRGTYVTVQVEYDIPGGRFGAGLAAVAGKHPEFVVREDLRRFKSLIETGEVPTTLGQSHGPRGLHGRAEQVLFRETSNRAEPQASPELRKTA